LAEHAPIQPILPLITTVYSTRYDTRYAVITRYYSKISEDTYLLKREETRYVTPEEYRRIVEEGKRKKKEKSTAVGVAV
jgi:hypothetical protein